MILDVIPNYFQTRTTDINLETTMTIQTLKKTIGSQIDQSMQPFVPSYREINKTLWQVKKIIHSTQIDRMLCNMLGPYRSSSMPTLFVAASTWDLQTNVDLGKSDIIHTCKLMFSTNSFNKRVNQGKEKGEKTKNSWTYIIQHPVLLYWLQVFQFRPMLLCGFLNLQKAVAHSIFLITCISKNHDNF
jgi:hypothetical protein